MSNANDVDLIVMPDYRRLCDMFTEVVATRLHHFDIENEIDLATCRAADIVEMTEGSIKRYQNDPIFHAKVQSVTAQLMQAVDLEREERLSRIDGGYGRFKLVEA